MSESRSAGRVSLAVAALLAAAAVQTAPVGHWKDFEFAEPDLTPVVFGGECRTKDVRAVDCCLYLDVFHADGSVTYTAPVRPPTSGRCVGERKLKWA